jgi:hypothetical protein
MADDTTAGAPDRPLSGATHKSLSAWSKYGRWGSIFRSIDFELSVPVGLGFGALPAFVKAVSSGAVPILIAFGGALGGIAALVVVAITLFVAIITPEYLVMMEQVQGGLRGAVRPYYLVVLVSMVGLLVSFGAALAWPAIPSHSPWLRWLVFGMAAFFTSWGVLGTVQLVALGNFHIEQRARLAEVLRQIRKLQKPDPK